MRAVKESALPGEEKQQRPPVQGIDGRVSGIHSDSDVCIHLTAKYCTGDCGRRRICVAGDPPFGARAEALFVVLFGFPILVVIHY